MTGHSGYSLGMNQEICDAVKQLMKEEGVSQVQLAKELNINRENLTRMLSGRSSKPPVLWQKILKRFDLELTVRPAPARAEGEA